VFPRDRIRFKGEALAGVVAVSESIAEAALAKIRVTVEELPHAVEIADAAKPDAAPMYEGHPRVSAPEEVGCGDIEDGFSQADIIVDHAYTVPVREHAPMEPESAVAYEENGQIVIRTGLYHAFVQGTESIANNLAIDQADVRIICPAMGGNFGTRGDTLIAVTSALMARKTGRPVKIVFSRAAALILGMSLWITYDVVARSWFGVGSPWSFDLSEYALVWITFLDAPWVLLQDRHVRIELLVDIRPVNAQRILGLTVSLVACAACAILTWRSGIAAIGYFESNIMMPRIWRIPRV
jgi:TRAP-type C4-dicarboxylate transport system permease small subunit